MTARILAVDDSESNLVQIQLFLADEDMAVETATSGEAALGRLLREDFDLVLLDVVLPSLDGFEVCRRLKRDPRTADLPVLFLTGRARDDAARLMGFQVGAADFLTKPFRREELVARIHVLLSLHQRIHHLTDRCADLELRTRLEGQRAQALQFEAVALREVLRAERDAPLRVSRRQDSAGGPDPERPVERRAVPGPDDGEWVVERDVVDVARREAELRARERAVAEADEERETAAGAAARGYRIREFLGESECLQDLHDLVSRLRDVRATVLIEGETGTGKELVARALHYDGRYASRPFLPIHCGAISPELIESELFGYEKGAFTGAQDRKDGLFTAADGGTVFLDEIAEASLDLQVKLLRVLQLGEIRPVGASRPRHVDVRIVAATNRDLAAMVEEGRFREDLYYRLQCVTLQIAPLRDRIDDLPALTERLLAEWNERLAPPVPLTGVSHAALEAMRTYDWPGNVRELENVLKAAVAIGRNEVLQVEDLPAGLRGVRMPRPQGAITDPAVDLQGRRDEIDRDAFARALAAHDGDKRAAAAALGMSRSTFYRRLKKLENPGSASVAKARHPLSCDAADGRNLNR